MATGWRERRNRYQILFKQLGTVRTNTVTHAMIYLLLILFPLAAAVGAFVLRRDSTLTGWLGVAVLASELWLALSVPINQPAQLLDLSINYNELGRLFLATFSLSSLALALLTTLVPQGENFVAILLLIVGLSATILIVQEPFVAAVVLLLASLAGSLQLVDQPAGSAVLLRPQTLGMALKYTLLVALGGVLLLIGVVLATAFSTQLARSGPTLTNAVFGLLLVGFGIRFGLIPFHWWLPDVLDETPPAAMFLHVGMLTILALPVLLVVLQTQPQLLAGNATGHHLILGLGGLSVLGGSAQALLTLQARRAIAGLAIANLGLLAIGMALSTIAGIGAVLLGALNHVFSMALIALGLTLLERDVPGRREQAGALRERSLAALAFLVGILLLLGVPPLSGFTPRLLLIHAMQGQGVLVGSLVAAALVLSSLAGARLIARMLLQPRDMPTIRSLFSDDLDRLGMVAVPYAPWGVRILIVLLASFSLGLGLWPQPVVMELDDIARAFPFLSR